MSTSSDMGRRGEGSGVFDVSDEPHGSRSLRVAPIVVRTSAGDGGSIDHG